jgi:beta-mannosidase
MNSKTLFINENWQFRRVGSNDWLPGKVPGTVHSDLKINKLINDPFFRLNENDVQWIEMEDWEYRTFFEVDKVMLENDVVELSFDGLDTYADVFLNGILILQADNMFLGWKIPCKEHLICGCNELIICFHSPVKRGLEKMKTFGHAIPAPNELAPEEKRTSPFTRKAAFHYGWDWGPRLLTSGIWRPVKLLAWSDAQIEDAYVATKSINNQQANIQIEIEINVAQSSDYSILLLINGQEFTSLNKRRFSPGNHKTNFNIVIEHPQLWWPNGLGEAHLYDFEFRLMWDRKLIHNKHVRHGIRTVKLVQKPDQAGHSFCFEVNNYPVFMKGANVIPPETLTSEATGETFQKLTRCAIEANMNMLRVWGGGVYMDDHFYDMCSAGGLLVWQDFMFACSLQPGDKDHLESIKTEAAFNVKRLRNQACLALWCGNNENLTGWHKWGWQEKFDPVTRDQMWLTYQTIFHTILLETVNHHDPKTSYRATSPATVNYQLPDRRSGDEHDWTIWFGQKPIETFHDNIPRFVSEWGLQSFPEMNTILSFAINDDLSLHSKVMSHRQRSRMDWLQPGWDGNLMIKWYVQQYFNLSDNFQDLVEKSRLLQALAYKTAIEAHRTAMPHCMGSLFWQLNDCWPTISWATVDYYFRWKPAHLAVKNAFAPVIITAREENGKVTVFAVSDKLVSFEAIFMLSFNDFDGNVFFDFETKVSVPANTSKMIYKNDFSALLQGDLKKNSLLHLELRAEAKTVAKNCIIFAKPKELTLRENDVDFFKTLNGMVSLW